MTIVLKDGLTLHSFIAHAIGSIEVPMTDEQLEGKFADLADGVIPASAIRPVMDACWNVESLINARGSRKCPLRLDRPWRAGGARQFDKAGCQKSVEQCFSFGVQHRHRTGFVSELYDGPRRRTIERPLRQTVAVGVPGLGETRPVFLHLIRQRPSRSDQGRSTDA